MADPREGGHLIIVDWVDRDDSVSAKTQNYVIAAWTGGKGLPVLPRTAWAKDPLPQNPFTKEG